MTALAYMIVTLIAAPVDAWFYGEVPQGTATFKIIFPGENADAYGAVLIDGNWMTGGGESSTDMRRVEIVFDTPWAPQPHAKELRSKLRLDYEAPVLRKKRLQEGWDAAGYDFVETKEGRRPVKRHEIEHARRAREMTLAVERASLPPALSAIAVNGPAVQDAPDPPFLQLWGGHILFGIFGLALMALVAKTLIFAGP